MVPKIFFLMVICLFATTVSGQSFSAAPDSCVVVVRFMSLDRIPYPGHLIVCNPENLKPISGVTDSLGKARFFIPRVSSLTFSAYNGSLLLGSYPFSIHNRPGLSLINFDIKEDFFQEDRTNEIVIDTTWANNRELLPLPGMIEVKVHVTNDEGIPLPMSVVLFRDTMSHQVFVGETNEIGTFNILIPRDQQYGVRIARLGNRFPVCDLSTTVDTLTSLLRLNVKFNQFEENSYVEYGHIASGNSGNPLWSGGAVPDLFVLKNMYFDFDKWTIQTASYPELNNLVAVLKRFPDMRIQIRGHTDNYGEDDYNQRLSERRSASVRNYLVENGISSRRIESAGYGEKLPVQSNETDAGRQANRRIEVKVLSR